MFNPDLPHPSDLKERFLTGRPFKHLCIDGFLDEGTAGALLRDFPPFDRAPKAEVFGSTGGQAVTEAIAEISSHYTLLHQWLYSAPFLGWLNEVTGISDLVFDPACFGGGVHEQLNGESQNPHTDFNYDQSGEWHRRLTLTIFLNATWKEEWGGITQFHSNPKDHQANSIVSYAPLFNRALLYENNEKTWNGFTKINIPHGRSENSRRSLNFFFYTKSRPEEETAPPHSTFYVQPPLPTKFKPGYTLQSKDGAELQQLLAERGQWIEFYQRKELQLSGHIVGLNARLKEFEYVFQVPTQGYVIQSGPAKGCWPDGWIGQQFSVPFTAQRLIRGLKIRFSQFQGLPSGTRVRFLLDNAPIGTLDLSGPVRTELVMPLTVEAGREFRFSIESTRSARPKDMGLGEDIRELVICLQSLIFEHI